MFSCIGCCRETCSNNGATPVVFAAADRITGIGTPFVQPSEADVPVQRSRQGAQDGTVRRSDHRSLLESAGGLAFMSTLGNLELPAILESLQRTKFLLFVCISIDVIYLMCLLVATLLQVASRDQAAAVSSDATTLPDVLSPDWIVFQPSNDQNAELGTARFRVRLPVVSQHLLTLGNGDASELVAISPLAIHVVALLFIHLLGLVSAWRGWQRGLSAYIGLLLAVNIARLSGAGMLVGRMSLGDVDPGGAPTFWFALRAIGDIFCVFIASHLRSKLSSSWFISFRSRLRF
jgi:hypothetical protein